MTPTERYRKALADDGPFPKGPLAIYLALWTTSLAVMVGFFYGVVVLASIAWNLVVG